MRLDERLIGQTTSDRKNLYEHISKIRDGAARWLEGIKKNGIDHSRRLEGYLNRLIPANLKESLKPAEVFVLLYAVYLHDIGYRKDDGSIEAKDHPKRSKEKILNDPNTYLFGDFPPIGSNPPRAAKAVATVCYGHAPESSCPLDSIDVRFPDYYLCSETLNLRLLVALLRLADEMDQPYVRLGPFREHISLVELGKDIVRWYWEDLGRNAGEALEKQVQKTKEALRVANDYLYAWGLPLRTIVLEPSLLDFVSPAKEPIDYKELIPKHYVPPRCHDAKEEDKGLLHDYVREWLDNPERKLLAVLGDYGIGKTSFCYKFASDLTGFQYTPVVIELKTMREANVPWEESIEREIKQRRPEAEHVVLMLDGFDELSLKFDKKTVLKKIRKLSETTQEFAKVILTSRTQFFRSQKEEWEMLARERGRPPQGPAPLPYSEKFERIYVSPFGNKEIKAYLNLSLGVKRGLPFWNQVIGEVFDLKDLTKRPILLELITKYSEDIKEIEGVVTPGRLYETVTAAWKEREGKRAPKNIMLFMEELAYRMFTKEEEQLHFYTLREAIEKYFDAETRGKLELSRDNLDYQIRGCSFLSRNAEGHYAFAHRSFIEYFVARKLSREIPDDKAEEIKITDETALFVSELIDPSVYERIEPPQGVKVP